MSRCTTSSRHLLAMAAAVVAACPLQAATDPLDPVAPVDATAASPLRVVTVATADRVAATRFFGNALAMTPSKVTTLAAPTATRLSLKGPVQVVTFTRSGIADAVAVRVVAAANPAPPLRPRHDALAAGGLAMGMPVHGQALREAIVTKAGFRSAVGVTKMMLPRADAPPYEVQEIHYQGPDGVLVLGIDRGSMKPVGGIDATTRIGGPAYSSVVVEDLVKTDTFMRDVMRYEKRRDAVFTSSGSKGGLGLPDGSRFAFQQWYAPGSTTGYVIVMKILDRAPAAPVAGGFANSGLVMWSFDVADLAVVASRAAAAGAKVVAAPSRRAPSLIVAMPDGFLVEFMARARR